jgi:cobalt-zinc-cadmium efflux system membrane fusion protein
MVLRRLLALALATLPAVAGCHHEEEASAQEALSSSAGDVSLTREQLVASKVEVGVVDEHPIDDTLTTSGRVVFDDMKVARVFSPVTGRVTALRAALGERVKKGDALATIQSPDIGQASADVSKANAALIAAEHDFKRKSELFPEKAVSAADYEASQDAFRQAKAEKERAEAKARLLHAGSADLVTQGYALASPIDGEVIARTVNPGAEVQGQYGGGSANELFTVGQLDRVWVLADLYELDLARVQVGAKVMVSVVAYPGKTFEGKVDWVSGALDPTTRTVRVRCTFDNADHLLKPEMYATVRIAVPSRDGLAVPRSAVFRMGEQNVVFVEHDAPDGKLHFERLPVVIDDLGGTPFVPVEHGLEKGMKIVTGGATVIAGMM